MAQGCPETIKVEGVKSRKAGEDSQIQLNLSEEDTYIDVESF